MGIIKATLTSAKGVAADQWKEAYISREMGNNVLMSYGKRLTGGRSSNNGSKNFITDGSTIIVGEGECAIATENGKVIYIFDQPGEHIFGSEASKGVFGGGMRSFFKDMGRRISYGGDLHCYHRLIYINTKELSGDTFSVKNIPFKFHDPNTGLDIDGDASCSGTYSFRITNPERFYRAVVRATASKERRQMLRQMEGELRTVLSQLLASTMAEGVRPSDLPQHTEVLSQKLGQLLNEKWSDLRGIETFSVAIDSIYTTDTGLIQGTQHDAMLRDPTMAAAHLTAATGDAMRSAATHSGGAAPAAIAAILPAGASDTWKCSCGSQNDRNFCRMCGSARPVQWVCICGCTNKSKFCENCGAPNPTGQ